MHKFKFKKSTNRLAEDEVRRAYEELKEQKTSSLEAERITQNIERIRKAEALRRGNPRPKIDPTRILEVGLGTLIPTWMILTAEKEDNVVIFSKVFSKIKFK